MMLQNPLSRFAFFSAERRHTGRPVNKLFSIFIVEIPVKINQLSHANKLDSMRTTITKILLLFGAYCIPAKLTIAQTVIKLDKEHNEYTTPCVVNGLKLKLEIATANFEVGISQVEATFMIKNGYIKESDVLNSKLYETASGEIAEGAEVTLREINISGLVLHDVKAIVIGSERAPLLIGQNALSRLGKITLD